jgi:hypothetical protein
MRESFGNRASVNYMFLHLAEARIMVQSWSTNWCQPLLNTLLGATRVAYFQSVTSFHGGNTGSNPVGDAK